MKDRIDRALTKLFFRDYSKLSFLVPIFKVLIIGIVIILLILTFLIGLPVFNKWGDTLYENELMVRYGQPAVDYYRDMHNTEYGQELEEGVAKIINSDTFEFNGNKLDLSLYTSDIDGQTWKVVNISENASIAEGERSENRMTGVLKSEASGNGYCERIYGSDDKVMKDVLIKFNIREDLSLYSVRVISQYAGE